MGTIKLAINGFGRIGRQAAKALFDKIERGELDKTAIELVVVNDLADAKTLAHLLKYDSVYGVLEQKVSWSDEPDNRAFSGEIKVGESIFGVLSEPDPARLPWKKLGVDVVIESTGRFTDAASVQAHLKAGAPMVILSAPVKGEGINTYVMGVNMDKISPKEKIISNASCTTNCIAPVMAIIEERFGIENSLMTTVHAFTADQMLVDGPHHDLRRARTAPLNIIPTTTGAARAAAETLPSLKGHFDGLSMRVPVAVGSISDITIVLRHEATAADINAAISEECRNPRWRGIVSCTSDPIVSSDIIGNPHSAIVDLSLTQVIGKNLAKVIAWYDNEWGYANRLIEQAIVVGANARK